MHITILAIGKMKDAAQKAMVETYMRRMQWAVTLVELPEDADPTAKIPKGAYVIALDERGKSPGSAALGKLFQDRMNEGLSHICILIGGADGHSQETRAKANMLLGFGAMTWPHMLVRIMLMEQLYRIQQILAGHPYHREG